MSEVKFLQYRKGCAWQNVAKSEENDISMTHQKFVLMAAWLSATLSLTGAENQATLNPHLEPLRPLLGKTWKGTFDGSKPEKPTVDVARWERALNGQAVRMLHSINQGVYGGETLFVWNDKSQSVEYFYFTTAGFMTTGVMEVKNGKIETREQVKGEASGVTEVRGTSEILAEGKFHVKAEYLKNGQWTLGHEVTYREDASSEVVFK
jgi:hypothetical protein